MDCEVKESKTICKISHFYFSEHMYVYKNLEEYARCQQWLAMGSRITDDFNFISTCLLFFKKPFFLHDTCIILKGKKNFQKRILED